MILQRIIAQLNITKRCSHRPQEYKLILVMMST